MCRYGFAVTVGAFEERAGAENHAQGLARRNGWSLDVTQPERVLLPPGASYLYDEFGQPYRAINVGQRSTTDAEDDQARARRTQYDDKGQPYR